MAKDIIIDGVNVAECEYYYEMDDCDGNHQLCNNATDIKNEYCEHYKNCYFKKLKRLEKENEELKEKKDKYYLKTLDYEMQISDLIEALEEIREIAKIDDINTCWTILNECDNCQCSADCGIQSPIKRLKVIKDKLNEVLND